MKRFHVHVAVPNLAESIRFYSTMFGAQPSVVKDDYAKWMLEDPRVNFAISQRGGVPGVNHLGLQTDSDEELELLHGQLEQADVAYGAGWVTAADLIIGRAPLDPTDPALEGDPIPAELA